MGSEFGSFTAESKPGGGEGGFRHQPSSLIAPRGAACLWLLSAWLFGGSSCSVVSDCTPQCPGPQGLPSGLPCRECASKGGVRGLQTPGLLSQSNSVLEELFLGDFVWCGEVPCHLRKEKEKKPYEISPVCTLSLLSLQMSFSTLFQARPFKGAVSPPAPGTP